MTMSMTIRDATSADVPALAELITQLGYPTTPEQMASRFDRLQLHSDYRLLLAEDEQGAVGLIGLHRGLSWEADDDYVRITVLVVHGRARRQGVGEALIDVAEGWTRAQGISRLILNSGNRPERAAAHQFYPRLGFTASSTGYSKTL
jgi:GNAT superfamily N-acetyltransferase